MKIHKDLYTNNLSGNNDNKKKVRKTRNPLHPEVQSKIKELKKLLRNQDSTCWVIGDACVELMDTYYLSLRDIGDATNYTKSRISHFHLTSRAFPHDKRDGYTFQDSLNARQIYQCMSRLNMSVFEIRDRISKLKDRTSRSIRAHFVQLLMDNEINSSIANSSKLGIQGGKIVNNCHNSDWRSIIPQLPDNSVKLFIADPPFGGYQHAKDGTYISSLSQTSGMRSDCDNGTTDGAIEVTLPLFEMCMPKLAKNGVLLLFQAGARTDRPEILMEAQKQGWNCKYSLTWLKGHNVVGDHHSPYRVCTEKILVFIKEGDRVLMHEKGTPSSDVLDFRTQTMNVTRMMDCGSMEYGDYHQFQKPENLMDFLVKTHTYPGDLVVEPFGCSGSGVISAIKNDRKWVYIESNKNNFAWAENKIQKVISSLSSHVG